MLTPRNVIVLLVVVLVLSLGGSLISLMQPPDSDGRADDSYGTRGDGYRALFETLEALGVPAERSLGPPDPSQVADRTLLLLTPDADLAASEPKYLHDLVDWIERGGRVIVSPSELPWYARLGDDSERVDAAALEALGLPEVRLTAWVDPEAAERQYTEEDFGLDSVMDAWERAAAEEPLPDMIEVEMRGAWDGLAESVTQLAVPREGEVRAIEFGSREPSGTVVWTNPDDEELILLASFSMGEGEIVVVAEPRVLSNRMLAREDNSVLAAHLAAGPLGEQPRTAVVFDEFYHGLGVRGNPLYLLTRPGPAAVAAALLLAVAVGTWRSAVFLGPPLADRQRPRRDISEYIDAMSRFFSAGPGSRRFLVEEVASGVLRQLCDELHLPPDTPDTDRIVAALARRDPQRAEALSAAQRLVDAVLRQPGRVSQTECFLAMQRMVACL